MHDLIDDVFVEMFDSNGQAPLEDQARLVYRAWRHLAIDLLSPPIPTSSSHRFPGGNIGKLAICGTVNDLAVGGAIPLYLSCSVIIEEGLPVDTLRMVARTMAETARTPG